MKDWGYRNTNNTFPTKCPEWGSLLPGNMFTNLNSEYFNGFSKKNKSLNLKRNE